MKRRDFIASLITASVAAKLLSAETRPERIRMGILAKDSNGVEYWLRGPDGQIIEWTQELVRA